MQSVKKMWRKGEYGTRAYNEGSSLVGGLSDHLAFKDF